MKLARNAREKIMLRETETYQKTLTHSLKKKRDTASCLCVTN
jgi:hypothetical protein